MFLAKKPVRALRCEREKREERREREKEGTGAIDLPGVRMGDLGLD
jgi:hypothetical protein